MFCPVDAICHLLFRVNNQGHTHRIDFSQETPHFTGHSPLLGSSLLWYESPCQPLPRARGYEKIGRPILNADTEIDWEVLLARRKRPPRICHLSNYYPPHVGGIENHVRALAQAQVESGAEVRVICVHHAGRATVEDRDGDVRVLRLGRLFSVARLEVCPQLPLLARWLGDPSLDIVHYHAPHLTMVLALTLLRPRVPLVITHHCDVVRRSVLAPAMRPLEKRVFARAERILATTPSYAAGSSWLRRYADKVSVLPLGMDLQPYLCPSRAAIEHARRLRADHPGPLWLTVGRLVYYKGLHHALAALRHVPGKLLMIGEGPLRQALIRQTVALGVADRVIWCGRVNADQLVGAYHAATALWFPSNLRTEAFGLVQVEAMASGCPVINCAIPVSGVSWVSRHEISGLTVSPGDPAALAQAARRLLAEPGLRERLGAGGQRRTRQKFDKQHMIQRCLAAYETVLSRRSEVAA